MKNLLVLMIIVVAPATLVGQNTDSCGVHHAGLFFEVAALPFLHASSTLGNGGVNVTISPGYVIGENSAVLVSFQSGSESLADEMTRPASGRMLIGGASLEVLRYFGESAVYRRPFVGVGGGLTTLLQKVSGRGYNGNCAFLEGGVQWEVSDNLYLRTALQYRWVHWFNFVGTLNADESFSSFTDGEIALGVTVAFYPNITP